MATHFKKSKNQLTIANIGKEDINFPEFVLGVLDKNSSQHKDEIMFQDPINPDQKISISSGIHGFPTQFTRDLYRGLMRLTYLKNKFNSKKINCTLREICRELGIKPTGKAMHQIRESLDILTETRVKFYYSYFNIRENDKIDKVTSIGILDGYTLAEYNKKKNKDKGANTLENFISWSPSFWDLSLKEAKNLINYDYSFYISLSGNITKELYIFLNKRAFNKKFFKIPIRILAFEKLGMSRNLTNKLFKVRQQLRKAHQELLEKGFFDSEPRFVKTSDNEWVHYSFAVRHKTDSEKKESLFLEQTLLVFDEEKEKLKNDLKSIGFTEGQIGKFFDQHTTEFLQDGLDLLNITKNIKSPRNWFWGYLKGEYNTDVLEEYRKEKQEQEKRLKEQEQERQRLEEEEKKKEQESTKQKNLINDWIIKNPMQWVEMCQTYLENDFKKDNPVFHDRLIMIAKKQQKTPLEVFMASEMYNYKVRGMVLEIVKKK